MMFSFLAVVYSSFETARHPSLGGCGEFADEAAKRAASPVVTRAAASDPLRLRMPVIVRAKDQLLSPKFSRDNSFRIFH